MFLVVGIVVAVVLSLGMFSGTFTPPTVPVTLTADRSGLVLEPNSRVKMRGVQVGHVSSISGGDFTRIQLDIDPAQIQYIPANVEARIQSISLFGAKFVDLVYPPDPSPQRLSAGAVLRSQNVATEVNTVFQNVVELIKQIDPFKLNAVLSALAEGGVRGGQGDRIGEAITASNEVLLELNPRTDTMREDFRAIKGVSDTYSAAAKNIIDTLAAGTTTSVTVTTHAQQLDALLLNVVGGLSRSGVGLLSPSKDNLVKAVNLLEPTANLLMKYNPRDHLLVRRRQDDPRQRLCRHARRKRQIAHHGR